MEDVSGCKQRAKYTVFQMTILFYHNFMHKAAPLESGMQNKDLNGVNSDIFL